MTQLLPVDTSLSQFAVLRNTPLHTSDPQDGFGELTTFRTPSSPSHRIYSTSPFDNLVLAVLGAARSEDAVLFRVQGLGTRVEGLALKVVCESGVETYNMINGVFVHVWGLEF